VAAVHVLVPLKRLDSAKARLSGALEPDERARAHAGDARATLAAVRPVGAVTLVSSDPKAASLSAEHGVSWWDDRGLSWNAALAAAMGEVVTGAARRRRLGRPAARRDRGRRGARRGDADARRRDRPCARRRHERGLDAPSGRPRDVLRPARVVRTSRRHRRRGRRSRGDRGEGGPALDLDTPEDAGAALAIGRDSPALELLARMLERTMAA
jgi:2-phospho-L-lactate guanylyltransferase